MKILFIVLFICIIVGFFLYEKKRGDELAQFARQAGFSLEKGQQRLPGTLDQAGFYLFTQGSPYAMNVMQWLFYQPDQRTDSKAIPMWLDEIVRFLDQAGRDAG